MARKTKPSKLRLTNKKTGKLSSSSTWLLDLAATAVIQEQHSGIPSLLPQHKARKLLVHNELKPHKEQNKNRTTQGQPTKQDFRRLAREASNTLKMYYIQQLPDNKKPASVNNKGFRAWLVDNLANPGSKLNEFLAKHKEYKALVSLMRSDRWWQETLALDAKNAE